MEKRLYVYQASHGFGGREGVLIISQVDRAEKTLAEWIFTQPPPWEMVFKLRCNMPSQEGLRRQGLDPRLALTPELMNREISSRAKAAIMQRVIESRDPILNDYLRIRGAPDFAVMDDVDTSLFRHIFSCHENELAEIATFFARPLDTDVYTKVAMYKAIREQMKPESE